jgi:hypothetical protein
MVKDLKSEWKQVFLERVRFGEKKNKLVMFGENKLFENN